MPNDLAREIAERLYEAGLLQTDGADNGAGVTDLIRPLMAEDTALLDWWEAHLNYEHGTDYESGEVVLYRVSGNINDRVWDEKSRAATLREAIRAASAKDGGIQAVERAASIEPDRTYTKAEFLAAINELPDFTVDWKHTGNVMGQIMTAKFLLKKVI